MAIGKTNFHREMPRFVGCISVFSHFWMISHGPLNFVLRTKTLAFLNVFVSFYVDRYNYLFHFCLLTQHKKFQQYKKKTIPINEISSKCLNSGRNIDFYELILFIKCSQSWNPTSYSCSWINTRKRYDQKSTKWMIPPSIMMPIRTSIVLSGYSQFKTS